MPDLNSESTVNLGNLQVWEPSTEPVAPNTNNFLHFQAVAASVWSIAHGLGFYPNVTVVNSAGSQVEGDVVYVDNSSLTITFSGSFAGSAFCS